MKKNKFIISILILLTLIVSCSKIKSIMGGDRLYFCEKYTTKEVGESSKFTTGNITIMLKLKNPIGAKSVDINITNLSSGKVEDTVTFDVQSDWDYIHFDDVSFKEPGKYKVSCLRKDGTVIATGEVEITK
jgi:hypothetical protein